MEEKKFEINHSWFIVGLMFFTFLLVGQFIKETFYFIVYGFEDITLLELSSIFSNYYLIIIGIILGLGFISIILKLNCKKTNK